MSHDHRQQMRMNCVNALEFLQEPIFELTNHILEQSSNLANNLQSKSASNEQKLFEVIGRYIRYLPRNKMGPMKKLQFKQLC